MKLYELTYLSKPGLQEDEQKIVLERVLAVLGENAPVSQHFSGFWTTMDFNANPEKIKEIDDNLKKEPQIERSIIVKKAPVRFKARTLRRAEFSKRIEMAQEKASRKEGGKPKIELQEIEKKLDEILKD